MRSLREWLACVAHAALVEVTERLAPSADLLPDTEDELSSLAARRITSLLVAQRANQRNPVVLASDFARWEAQCHEGAES